ncbi:glucuronate isomerase [Rhodobacteraceae bacterium RKSG542]|uniref:glucuronate isomerase n=1 Tax=Pseudovibrio flavus TaxID=2529854 RepID=UPI0012BC0932|nr:glucuronate isomerase [Pseudovibrio flavus]MTI17964.1 glucuronate isomerase [Pseudovibrio flavus]
MYKFLTEDFLLNSDVARELYHDHASKMPIIDYHCHLPPQEIGDDYRFKNLADIWLKGDHYKWRAMRTHGVPEEYCTGAVPDKDKFLAWAGTVPKTIGNPLYHWTHLELRRPFGITDTLLSPETADKIWDEANEMLATPEFSARGIMQQMNVKMVGTTDDPIDSLEHHAKLQADGSFGVKVLPSWRPDYSYGVNSPDYINYLGKLSEASGIEINDYTSLCDALINRMDHFAAHGCCIADHALDTVEYCDSTDVELQKIIKDRLSGNLVSAQDAAKVKTALLIFLGREYSKRNWVQQYHIGAMRSVNTTMVARIGHSTGFDSIHDEVFAKALGSLLDALERENALPKTILYCLNPRDNEVLATMCGNFQGAGIHGKIQFGSGWWFNDQKDGMIRQIEQLSQMGLLSHFVGMLTDSRSFLSYTRHEYFRRLLCRIIGNWVVEGEAPHDMKLLSGMVEDICFNNANRYFELNLPR